ncbi:MAG: DNA replication/repair protein RecF [Xanthomonadales bacterium]|nr:DNA replication/repair protein RecF [Xanthomonadales bacterium]
MYIKSLQINNLRNIGSAKIEPDPGVNIFSGDNGAGKSTILEALTVLSKGRSFRSGQVSSLIGPEGATFTVFARTSDDGQRGNALGLERGRDGWTARLNGTPVRQLSELALSLPFVLIEPNSHLLVSGPPDTRRRFMDWGVFHVEPQHLSNWRRYSRALKQRNAALKAGQRDVVASLGPVMNELAEQLHRARQAQLEPWLDSVSNLLNELSPRLGELRFQYRKGWKEDHYAEALDRHRDADFERGQTYAGPHRAEMAMTIDGQAARERLSRGEQKQLAAGLLLSQAVQLKQSGVTPLMLLDDLASEFDRHHLERTLSLCCDLQAQLWLTGTGPEPYRRCIPAAGKMFHVEQGCVRTQSAG